MRCARSLPWLVAAAVIGTAAASFVFWPAEPDVEAMKAQYRRPAGAIPAPAGNPITEAKVLLGKTLFFDPRLSGGNSLSCASCHMPAHGFEDPRARSIGEPGAPLARNTPTLWNLAWEETFFWDGRASSLEEQAAGPITNPLEMNQDLDALVVELSAVEGYRDLFAAAFPPQPTVSADNIARALAAFQRTLVSPGSPFDAWLAGDEAAIDDAAKRGFVLFNDKAGCAACHSGWAFTSREFHDIGLPDADQGRGPVLGLPEFDHAFKTPTLRDIARRAPYMHDGSLPNLEAAVRHYVDGITERPTLSPDLPRIELTEREVQDLVAFMQTLTVPEQAHSLTPPELPK